MKSYLNGRIKGNTTVHLFSEHPLVKGWFSSVTPVCGSGNRKRHTSRVKLTGDELTCKKCKAILYGEVTDE